MDIIKIIIEFCPFIKKYNMKATSLVAGSRIKKKIDTYYKYKDLFIGLSSINKISWIIPFSITNLIHLTFINILKWIITTLNKIKPIS